MNLMLLNMNDKFFFDLAIELKKNSNIICITSFDKYFNEFNKYFPKIDVFNITDFFDYKKINKYNCSFNNALSEEFIHDMSRAECYFMHNSDRYCYFPESIRKRNLIYKDNLLFWYNYLKSNSIQRIFIDTTPHSCYDNVIYYIAKKLNIDIKFIERTAFPDRVFLSNDYDKIHKVPSDKYSLKSINEIRKDIPTELINYIEKEFSKANISAWDKASNKNISKISLSYLPLFDKIKISYKNFKSYPLSRNIKIIFNHILKPIKQVRVLTHNIINMNTLFYNSALFFNKNNYKRHYVRKINKFEVKKIKSLYEYYKNLCGSSDLEKKFIYFPLHYQPERTTMPKGGIFNDQILAIDILSKSIPDDWIIYVKEHPRQFENDRMILRRSHSRDKNYYDRLKIYKNVKLISINENSEELIKKSLFSCTITGSAGWKSLLIDKACIVFGNPWYSMCNSCYVVKSIDDCKYAIKNILTKQTDEIKKDLFEFIHYLKDELIVSSNSYEYAIESTISYDILLQNLKERLLK